ncbi:hypothetical protein GR160_18835 [Flavobacterium sp. Sd200]|uniref:hypothetical protein n=1 Tax=Flavobacterium sp. Sd200 TaxID=2692211 RepID=UPI001369DB3F|nr:hypothetical protein [Flavobacterium sp. Sd200]MXN93287.1 hypothetical protein [Flavobacterium sp. Sd200]
MKAAFQFTCPFFILPACCRVADRFPQLRADVSLKCPARTGGKCSARYNLPGSLPTRRLRLTGTKTGINLCIV